MSKSTNTTWDQNFVYGYNMGFLTDDSQYVFISDDAFRNITGYERSDYQDVLWP